MPDRLIADGPFRFVRHPFYLGYMLGALAAPIAIDSILLAVLAVLMIIITLFAAFREERVWMRGPKAAAYREYRKQTAMFLPFIGRGR